MTSIRLVALDLDGTLLTSQKTISKTNQEALFLAKEKGVKVVLTTGRPLKSIEPFLTELELDGKANEYSITFNGGLVQKNSGERFYQASLSYFQVKEIYTLTHQLQLPLDVICDETVYQIAENGPSLYAQCNPTLDFQQVRFEELPREIGYNKCVCAYQMEGLDGAIARIPAVYYDQFEIVKSRDILLEWCPKGVHKAVGLAQLARHLKIDKKEIIAIGDAENDLSMIRWAGIGLAMKNAVSTVQAAADRVIPLDHDHDGVAWAIDHYVVKEREDGVI